MTASALTGATLVLPDRLLDGHALLLSGDRIEGVVPIGDVPPDYPTHDLGGGWLLPGFIDTQVNGGGDVLLNDQPTVEGVRAIAAAHRRFGTTGMLPTLISDRADVVDKAIAAVGDAIRQGVPGVLGIHVEGPHLNPDKRGIHDASRFAPIDDRVIERLSVPGPGIRLVTLAPELAPRGAIRQLVDRGVIVAAGHSMADYDQTRAALDEGMTGFTHLFNAMTQLNSREPGMVGAALDDRRSFFGLIVDGLHVHPATLRVALASRGGQGAMLVTDAMPPAGGTATSFDLTGRTIEVTDGTCRGPDGTLAGSALTMDQSFRNTLDLLRLSIPQTSRLASAEPAAFLGLSSETGALAEGLRADLVHLDSACRVRTTWIRGQRAATDE